MKKLLATLLASTMAVSAIGALTACGDEASAKTLTVWAPEAAHAVYTKLANEWKSQNEKYKDWTIKFEAKAEGEAETDFGADPAAGADIFFFESGNIKTMKDKLYLQELDQATTNKIKARDGSTADFIIDSTSGLAWGFPTTADNGYFLWYDKTFFTNADDVKSLDKMLEKINDYNKDKTEEQKKHLVFPFDNGWYEVSWFFGLGCELDWVGDTTNYYTNIHTTAEGLAAGKAAIKYGTNEAMITGDDGTITAGFGKGTVVAAIDGTWIYQALAGDAENNIPSVLGDRKYDDVIAATKLPTFKAKVGDGEEKEYQMGSFKGGKFCGINRYKNNVETITASISLADYFTSEKGQLERFKSTNAVPSNTNVASSDAVKNNMLAAALAAQNAQPESVPQLAQDGLWEAMKAFGQAIRAGETTEANLQKALNDLAQAMAKGGTLVTSK